ncbi:MAG TPA: FAD-dependent oxidoreductase [Hydrogenophaga sp.]|uniref:glycerol-3-phosphate dehydrogenase/oxidase n=1 Tax=Hydrogenophaga sp. TaxID=1904254 RepID=UPI0008C88B9A|nr:glycerol-3-phosphate dehydrogenase/oxidase [Hydrogenophaga sp.]OGA75430.1 MAG: FAD-dependent oxidoreductase [Burkholderiales bacterium GWE1_65_30]OGA93555.1 MAG: FAD-dependent oxidoreductase [Burkholderiales bacterium GWF1_66_17]HAX19365.1 FAD-dependent oxidoreductase [Hydrogenophaga sp.]HBU18687.1 FAD-dependent oxidoreductase [Hydrogenophaga sp.]
MKRAELLQSLSGTPLFDLAVVGGGATGLGVALDAALRGFSVVLLESHDFAGGTSSRSTKLLHGGVRYLAQGNVALVREALAERATVLRIAPHLAQPLPFVMPSYGWWQTPFYGVGLKLYDLMAGRAGLGRTAFLNRRQTLEALPGVNPLGLHGGVQYWDGQFDDARLALALARTAEAAGALVLNYARVTAVHRLDDAGHPVSELDVSDRFSEERYKVRARCVVNATGVWVDELRAHSSGATAQDAPKRMVSPSQGVHVVVDRDFLPGDHALLVPKTRDGRVLFAVPWLGKLVLGTTDTPRQDLPREPDAFAEELDFILSEAGHVLSRPVTRADIRSIWVGLRPLVAPPETIEGGTKVLSREHTIVVDANGLVTVTGGKWTTYRAMAEDVLDRCFASGLLPGRPGGLSEHHTLLGAPGPEAPATAICAPPGLHLYGTEKQRVLDCPGHDRSLGMGLTEAMVRYAVRHEHAHTVEDVLARRWRVLFLDARAAAGMAPDVAAILAQEQAADPALDRFLSLCDHYLPSRTAVFAQKPVDKPKV